MELIQVKRLTIEPEISPLDSEVSLTVQFSVADMGGGHSIGIKWVLTYVMDSAGRRQ